MPVEIDGSVAGVGISAPWSSPASSTEHIDRHSGVVVSENLGVGGKNRASFVLRLSLWCFSSCKPSLESDLHLPSSQITLPFEMKGGVDALLSPSVSSSVFYYGFQPPPRAL